MKKIFKKLASSLIGLLFLGSFSPLSFAQEAVMSAEVLGDTSLGKPILIEYADLDQDGQIDPIIAYDSKKVRAKHQIFSVPVKIVDLEVADVNNDGRLDLIALGEDGLLYKEPVRYRTCKEIHNASAHQGDGLYLIHSGTQGISVYCDMSNGGWTLVGYSHSRGTVFPKLNQNQGLWQPGQRNNAASINAIPIAQLSTQIAFAHHPSENHTGNLWTYPNRVLVAIPSPATVQFDPNNPATRGECLEIPFSALSYAGVVPWNEPRVTYKNAIGFQWTGNSSTIYGLGNRVHNCVNFSSGAVAFDTEKTQENWILGEHNKQVGSVSVWLK